MEEEKGGKEEEEEKGEDGGTRGRDNILAKVEVEASASAR
jgi:hypothetical protein